MRKFKTALLSILALVLGLFCLASCGEKENSGEVNYAGTYKFESMVVTSEGATVTLKVGETYMGMISLSADFMVVELKADGSASLSMAMLEGEVTTGTWAKSETAGKIVLTFEDEAETVSCDGSTLVMDEEGMGTLTLKKAA